MRFAGLCGVGLLALSTSSFAADFPILRGSSGPPVGPAIYYPWQGFYVGGQGGWATNGVNYGNATAPLVAFMLRNTDIESTFNISGWTTLGKRDTPGTSYGGFIGYNFQWDDAVLGIEFNYNRASLHTGALDSMTRAGMVTAIARHDVTVSALGAVTITDFATLRGRGGWAFGPIMPYVTAGVAIARADINKEAHVWDDWCDITINPACTPVPQFSSVEQNNKIGVFGYGFALGAGIDYAVLPNLFLRAEYEYLGFSNYNELRVNISSVRGGAALKF
jgi:opacity protein-like surface antigen